ncbi:glycosyltransferase [Candidatus Roizmanbacteria bacterium]|nr:glycosyltransferase [Candidatus Roizmanbacteria bacterium]
MAKNNRVALVHDFLKEYGGAERVVEALHDMFPGAPVYTSFVDYDSLGPHADRIKKWHIVESPFGSSWLMRRFHSPLRFLAPWVWNSFDFSKFDVVISSSGWYISRGITTKKPTLHICYLHHPPRHLYGYQTAMDWQKYWPVRVYGMVVNHLLRMYDYDTAQKVDYFIANSEETQRRIKKFYRRDSKVIYPPVEIRKQEAGIKNQELPESYFLIVSRLARAKHIDLVIKACQLLNQPLVIVGKGREEEYLKSLIDHRTSNIAFLGEVSDEELPAIYSNAKALVFPSEDEEFGIVPVEAMGYGVPVIALRSGGLPETIIEGKTGLLFDDLSVEAVVDAMKKFQKKSFTKQTIKKHAQKFSKERFEKEIREFINDKISKSL